MHAPTSTPDRRLSREHAPQTLPPILGLVGLGTDAPARLGAAPQPQLELPITLGVLILGALPAVLLYRRIQRPEVLDHDGRERIFETVAADAPVTVGGLADALDLDYKTVEHHVRVLEDFDLVESRRRGQLRELYPSGEAPPALPGPLAGEHATALALLQVVADSPGVTQSEAADRLDVARSTVHWHVQRLAEKGLLHDPQGAPGLVAGPELEAVEDALEREVAGPTAS